MTHKEKTPTRPHVDIVRDIRTDKLWWPDRRQASRGLGGNKEYVDFRGISWEDADRILTLEEELVTRIESSSNPYITYEEILEELYEDDEGLLHLDVGIAGVVVALSAATCIPFTSCNGGIYGDHHHEYYPLVGFYTRPKMASLLLNAATEAKIGLNGDGEVFAYSDNVRSMTAFARSLLNNCQ